MLLREKPAVSQTAPLTASSYPCAVQTQGRNAVTRVYLPNPPRQHARTSAAGMRSRTGRYECRHHNRPTVLAGVNIRQGSIGRKIQENSQPSPAAAGSHRARFVRALDNGGPYRCRIPRASSGMMWPCRAGTASMRNLSQRPTEASSRPVTPDRRKVGLEVSSIDSVTLSEGEVGRTRTLPPIWSALPMSSEPPHATQIGLIWARAACRSAGESASVAGERQRRRAWMLARADVRCGAGLGPWPAMSPESGEHRRGGASRWRRS
jgi:hypothetical protein